MTRSITPGDELRARLHELRTTPAHTGGPDERARAVLAADGAIPEFDLSDRMRKAMRYADVGVSEFADYLGVSRRAVGNWIAGRAIPALPTLRLWAIRTGVSFDWLLNGETPRPDSENPNGGEEVRHQGLEPRTRWYAETNLDVQWNNTDHGDALAPVVPIRSVPDTPAPFIAAITRRA